MSSMGKGLKNKN